MQQEEAYIFVAETDELDRLLGQCLKTSSSLRSDHATRLVHRMEHVSLERFLSGSEKKKLVERRKGNETLAKLYYNYRA